MPPLSRARFLKYFGDFNPLKKNKKILLLSYRHVVAKPARVVKMGQLAVFAHVQQLT
jgi:hypothetical protein